MADVATQTRPGEMAAGAAGTRSHKRRTRVGVVASDSREKTIKVEVKRLSRHAKYGKYLRRRIVLHAHDEKREAKVGDEVEVMECRPISKTKNWRLVRVLRRRGAES